MIIRAITRRGGTRGFNTSTLVTGTKNKHTNYIYK